MESQVTTQPKLVDFNDTNKAFGYLTDRELKFHYWMFRLMNNPSLTGISTTLAETALKWGLPVKWAAKPTVFNVFCGGETINESLAVVKKLGDRGVHSILDYSVEGQDEEKEFAQTEAEITRIIKLAKDNVNIPVSCIKISGVVSNRLLEKMSAGETLNASEQKAAADLYARFERLCKVCQETGVPIYVDAEETWLQPAIDELVEAMMAKYNKDKVLVFQTIQMFRHDRLEYYRNLIEKGRREGFKIGMKIVRGAYLDKENERAEEMGYPTPIYPNKEATDKAYNDSLKLSIDNIDWVEICAGTHNENSCQYLAQLMHEKGLKKDHPNIYFSQLFGMSDYLTLNLAAAGYNVSKYLPYGPVKHTLPYLIRRAKENTAIAGQMGREYSMILKEIDRRKRA